METSPTKASAGLARQLVRSVIVLLTVIAIGTIGFRVLEEMHWVDALYMSVITVSTVGFGEVRSLDPEGRLFTILLIFVGVGAFTYFGASVANYFVAGELRGVLERRRMENQIAKFPDTMSSADLGAWAPSWQAS